MKEANEQLQGVIARQKHVRSVLFYVCVVIALCCLCSVRAREVKEHCPSANEYLRATVPVIQEERSVSLRVVMYVAVN